MDLDPFFDLSGADQIDFVPQAASSDPFDTTVWDHEVEIRPRTTEIGTNLTWYAAGGARDTVIFVNQLKGAWPWSVTSPEASFDADGYVEAMPDGTRAVSEILRHSAAVADRDPFTGRFRLYGQGEGLFSIGTGIETDLAPRQWASSLPTETIGGETRWYVDFTYDVVPGKTGISLARLFVRDLIEGDHLHDLALVHHSHLDEFRAGEVFAPEFLSDIDSYGTLRFMDWMSTNILELAPDGSAQAPEQRYIPVDHYTYNTRAGQASSSFVGSVPIEQIVALANRVDADPWINLAADITDARAGQIATYVRDHLEPGLSVYFEYGNEVWNGARGFDSYSHAVHMAQATFADFSYSGLRAAAEWAAYRGPQLYDLIDAAFAGSAVDLHYVAPQWAYSDPVNDNGTIDAGSWSAIYFAAEQAQKMPDAPSHPDAICTDYAVGLYHGDLGPAEAHVMQTYASDSLRAEALARWLLFGLDATTFHDIGVSALTWPETVVWREDGLNIAVSKLVWADVQAGLDPLQDLDQVLRLVGDTLQYRGVHAAQWTTILRFDTVPTKALAEMIRDVELIGLGFLDGGKVTSGLAGSVKNSADVRLAGHLAFVEKLGMDFVGYEGGPHVANATAATAGLYNAFADEGWASVVMSAYLDRMELADVDLLMSYMSHNRSATPTDQWGARDYTGQSLAEATKARFLEETIAQGIAVHPDGYDPIAALGAPRIPAALAFQAADNWVWHGDGSLTETGLTRDAVVGVMAIEGGRSGQILRFDIADGVAAANNRLRVIVHAYGNGQQIVGSWSGLIVPGGHVELALGDIPAQYDFLKLSIARFGTRVGELTLDNISLEGPPLPAPGLAPEPLEVSILSDAVRAFDAAAWRQSGNWVLGGDGTATEAGAQNGVLATTIAIDPLHNAGIDRVLRFFVGTEVENAGRLRVHVQAAGAGGALTVKTWEADATDGWVSIPLDRFDIPHDRLQITLRRVGTEAGKLQLGSFNLVETIPVNVPGV